MTALAHTYGVGVCGTYEGVSPICPFPGPDPSFPLRPDIVAQSGKNVSKDQAFRAVYKWMH